MIAACDVMSAQLPSLEVGLHGAPLAVCLGPTEKRSVLRSRLRALCPLSLFTEVSQIFGLAHVEIHPILAPPALKAPQ
jgi:hypothetical protein